jgi:hypothetical protein
MASKIYIGVDIGLLGAIVIMHPEGHIEKAKMPLIGKVIDIPTLRRLIGRRDAVVVFEDLGVIFGSSKAAAFSMGYQVGIVEALCVAASMPYHKVKAKMWQKEMFQGVPELKKGEKRDTKGMALVACQRIFPGMDLTFTERAQKPHDGLVDALLIAEYAKRKNL